MSSRDCARCNQHHSPSDNCEATREDQRFSRVRSDQDGHSSQEVLTEQASSLSIARDASLSRKKHSSSSLSSRDDHKRVKTSSSNDEDSVSPDADPAEMSEHELLQSSIVMSLLSAMEVEWINFKAQDSMSSTEGMSDTETGGVRLPEDDTAMLDSQASQFQTDDTCEDEHEPEMDPWVGRSCEAEFGAEWFERNPAVLANELAARQRQHDVLFHDDLLQPVTAELYDAPDATLACSDDEQDLGPAIPLEHMGNEARLELFWQDQYVKRAPLLLYESDRVPDRIMEGMVDAQQPYMWLYLREHIAQVEPLSEEIEDLLLAVLISLDFASIRRALVAILGLTARTPAVRAARVRNFTAKEDRLILKPSLLQGKKVMPQSEIVVRHACGAPDQMVIRHRQFRDPELRPNLIASENATVLSRERYDQLLFEDFKNVVALRLGLSDRWSSSDMMPARVHAEMFLNSAEWDFDLAVDMYIEQMSREQL